VSVVAVAIDYPPEWDDVEDPEAVAEPTRDRRAEWRRYRAVAYTKACDIRDALRAALGNICKKCGAKENLSFQHMHGRTWEPRRQNLLQRMRLYKRDFDKGQIELLCVSCNGTDGNLNRAYYKAAKRKRRR
jgi:hypothetical protein